LAWGLIGGFAMMLVVGWSYGANMMKLWSLRLLRDQSLQRFWGLTQDNFYLTKQAGAFEFGKRVALGLNNLGYLHQKLLTSPALSQYHILPSIRSDHYSSFDRLWRDEKGKWKAKGFCLTGGKEGYRAPDLVIFAYRRADDAPWKMFGLTVVHGVPMVLDEQWKKDMEGIGVHTQPWPRRMLGEWSEEVALIEEPPADAQVSAWALNARTKNVQQASFSADFKAGGARGLSLDVLRRGMARE
jgi:hypothetical protein